MEKVDAPEHVRAYLENVRSDVGGKFEGVRKIRKKSRKEGKTGEGKRGRKEGKRRKKRESGRTRKRERGRTRKKEMGRIVNHEYHDISISHKH